MQGKARPGQAKGVAGWNRMDVIVAVGAVRVGGCRSNAMAPLRGHEGMGVKRLRVPVQTISLRAGFASRSGREYFGVKRARGCLQSAIQGRVSQNLRLIQVIFGHTASEE